MTELRYTLSTDGSSDESLRSILDWLLRTHLPHRPIHGEWADLRRLRSPPRTLVERIERSIALYPCDLLFVHRDAEKLPREQRVAEIAEAVGNTGGTSGVPPHIAVVPVRMQEAWFLFDEVAIRRAAGNPNGTGVLNLPRLPELEETPDPKKLLHEALRAASGLAGRRLQKLRVHRNVRRIGLFIEDFSPLRALPAFQVLEADIENAIRTHNG